MFFRPVPLPVGKVGLVWSFFREFGTGVREFGTGVREFGTGSREFGTGVREFGTGVFYFRLYFILSVDFR